MADIDPTLPAIDELNATADPKILAALTSLVSTVNALDTTNLADSAVTTAKIADLNVTAGKLAADAVTTAKILDANVTAAKIAAEAWTSYTPAVANSSVTLGTGGTITGYSVKRGRVVTVQGAIVLGTGGLFTGGPITITLPYAAAARNQTGSAFGYDASATQYATGVFEVLASASVGTPILNDGTTCTGVGGSNPWTWALSDELRWSITYETAA